MPFSASIESENDRKSSVSDSQIIQLTSNTLPGSCYDWVARILHFSAFIINSLEEPVTIVGFKFQLMLPIKGIGSECGMCTTYYLLWLLGNSLFSLLE